MTTPFPLTPAEAIQVAGTLTTHPYRLPHWHRWATELRDWGRANRDHNDNPEGNPS